MTKQVVRITEIALKKSRKLQQFISTVYPGVYLWHAPESASVLQGLPFGWHLPSASSGLQPPNAKTEAQIRDMGIPIPKIKLGSEHNFSWAEFLKNFYYDLWKAEGIIFDFECSQTSAPLPVFSGDVDPQHLLGWEPWAIIQRDWGI